jgi:hypothetical protein
MKTTVKQLKRLIKEELAAQAPEDAPLGQYAWPDERKLDVDEPDTAIERQLLKAITIAIDDTHKPLSDEYALMLQDFIKKRYYSSVINEPGNVKLFRGIAVNGDYVRQLGGDTSLGYGVIDKTLSFKPKKLVSSWSKKKQKAVEFAVDTMAFLRGQKEKFGIVLEADAQSNHGKFIDFKDIYKLNDTVKAFEAEAEALGIGDITINKIYFASREACTYMENIFNDLLDGNEITQTDKYLFAISATTKEQEIKVAQEAKLTAIEHLNFKSSEAAEIILRRIDDSCTTITPSSTLTDYAKYILATPSVYNLIDNGSYKLKSNMLSYFVQKLDHLK